MFPIAQDNLSSVPLFLRVLSESKAKTAWPVRNEPPEPVIYRIIYHKNSLAGEKNQIHGTNGSRMLFTLNSSTLRRPVRANFRIYGEYRICVDLRSRKNIRSVLVLAVYLSNTVRVWQTAGRYSTLSTKYNSGATCATRRANRLPKSKKWSEFYIFKYTFFFVSQILSQCILIWNRTLYHKLYHNVF